jgi:hypothetical protein
MGILVARQAYGENLNRWYCRGLPPAEREKWEVDRHAGAKGYKRASSPRAWKGGAVVLVPPEVWGLGRADRRSIRRDLGAASSPEGVARVMAIVGDMLAKRETSSLIGPAARPVLTSDQVKEWYATMARRKAARTESERTADLILPSSEKGGYTSSGHSSGAPPPMDPRVAAAQRIIDIRREEMRELGETVGEKGSLFQQRDARIAAAPDEEVFAKLRKQGVDEATIEKLRRAWDRKGLRKQIAERGEK